MSEMVDRVAKAIAKDLLEQWTARPRPAFDPEAFASVAIAAMREPTQAMVERGDDNRGRRISDDDPHSAVIWRDMIDEALKPASDA